jgi:hypothetical protein
VNVPFNTDIVDANMDGVFTKDENTSGWSGNKSAIQGFETEEEGWELQD